MKWQEENEFEWVRLDGSYVFTGTGCLRRSWYACGPRSRDILRTRSGATRKFATASAAMDALDEAFPLIRECA